jgi:acetyl-CoA carboxylase biotin carboxyl carrier protein
MRDPSRKYGNFMDFEKLAALTNWMSASPVAELEWSDGDLHIKLVKQPNLPIRSRSRSVDAAHPKRQSPPVADDLVTAPFFGIVHLTPSPDAPVFVSVGQRVQAGDTLCTIEAMKVFSALAAARSGVVAEILVRPGTEVTIGQPLFRVAAG